MRMWLPIEQAMRGEVAQKGRLIELVSAVLSPLSIDCHFTVTGTNFHGEEPD